jgi:outer membrane protein assembly factor BamA
VFFMRVKFFSTLFFIVLLLTAKANPGDTISFKKIKNVKLLIIPVIYYAPETKLGAGAAGVFRFKQKTEPDNMRHSNVLFALSITELRQIVLGAPFQFWFNREKYNMYGEATYQSVNYLFFGVGNHIPPYFKERYYATYPRLRVTALKRVYPHLYAGLKYAFDYTTITQLTDTGRLIKGYISGNNGGLVSGLGGALKYDNRDNQFYATKGYYVEFFALTNSVATGSSYRFDKYSLDMSTYIALPKKQVLAFNAYGTINTGNVPFYQMAVLGGDSKMRGLYQGRYRDKDAWILQAEYRAHLYWRLGFATFAALGAIAPDLNQFNLKYGHFTYGAGIRGLIDEKQHLNIRFDVGVNSTHLNYYFTIGEAF